MKVLILDNYDSFTYNLVHMIGILGSDCTVWRNDKIGLDAVAEFNKIILSPGPGIPKEAGIMKQVIKELGPEKSILGVCLGFQGIAEVYGATLYNMDTVLHGVTSQLQIIDKNEKLFSDVEDGSTIGHYHSWGVRLEIPNDELKITAKNEHGLIMGIRHKHYDVCGVQFHPESIMTQCGEKIISNWLAN